MGARQLGEDIASYSNRGYYGYTQMFDVDRCEEVRKGKSQGGAGGLYIYIYIYIHIYII